ncbi:MAG: helix-turn-helix transcriptional regulator [Bacteroidales bacterium]|nr:helix-turn-helix transcriptional regulator [Bacteroidales bacterium]
MLTFFERLDKYMKHKGLNDNKITVETGISNGIIGKGRKRGALSQENISKILHTYNEINANWLLTGKGDMLQQTHKSTPVAVKDKTGYPLVSINAVGGFGSSDFAIGERDIKDYYVVPKFKDRKIDFMIEVSGSSMYPKYNSGDVVACRIIRESKVIQWNKVYVVATSENGILIKRLHKSEDKECISIVSDNKEYAPFDLPKDEITGIALVVGVIRLE